MLGTLHPLFTFFGQYWVTPGRSKQAAIRVSL